MFPKLFLLLSGCALASTAAAQVAPVPETPKWQFFAEAGPKTSLFRNTVQSTNALTPGGYPSDYYRSFQVDNTYAAFADVKAFRYWSKHLAASGSMGLDLQQLDITTTTTLTGAPFRTSQGEHVVRLLTRVRIDAGLHAALGLGTAGQLLPGISIGQMVNVSKNGYSYSYVQPELCYLHGNLLVSVRASFAPYNTTLPDVEAISRRDDRAVVERTEYRVTDLAVGIGVRL
ncbi:hypothetical protein ACFP2F_19700 [Hymenobacter artigasi]|uniref:Outer membrane protein beta-barrel domain-containing protein n=1 Tax=Hymenobacter artigasi TaxID=2719616 RepID=A0ABX1HIW4_9BACT|nr:hypothetical protein [Hymenobacter artigasi]NKI90140.1 hypothetical protein [Hymenobacter artigasi]